MMLYHTTLRSNSGSIIANGFQPAMEGAIGGGVWCCEHPYWEAEVFAESPNQTDYGYFRFDLNEEDIEEYRMTNEDLGTSEWEIPYVIVNPAFTDRTFHPF